VVCDIARATWRKQKGCSEVDGIAVKFNVPRNCKNFRTKGFFFVELGLYPADRIAVPIRKNRDLDRFNGLLGSGWTCKTFGLTPSLEIVAYLSKEERELAPRRNVLGIDINAKWVAVSVVSSEGRILYQTYFGKQIWVRRTHLMERRGILQSVNAKRKLERLRTKESDFVKTNVGQLIREVIRIANMFDADISIEGLRRFSPRGRRFNRKVMRIPFYLFRRNLEARCFDYGITLNTVNPWHTSKWCIRCGAVGEGHSANYSVFRCPNCGLAMNADRKASVAIAVKSLLERNPSPNQNWFQISGRRVPVSGLVKASNEASVTAQGGAIPVAEVHESPRL
jgi:IS605 OrfB family transposase